MLDRFAGLGRQSQNNRILAEYYDIMQKQGKEVADAIYDVYESAGRFADGPTTLDQAADLLNTGKGKGVVLLPSSIPLTGAPPYSSSTRCRIAPSS